MNERAAMVTGATLGAFIGAFASYLFFTERGRELRERMEPAVDNLKQDFARFQTTLEKFGGMANDGLRAVNEFKMARAQSQFPGDRTSH